MMTNAGETGGATPPSGARGCVLALDVGGTGMKGAVVDRSGHPVAEITRPTPRADGPDAVVASVLATLDELRRHPAAADRRGVGLVVPGLVDASTGTAVWSENLGWQNVPFRSLVAERVGPPVAVGHDVRAGGLAEVRLGAARDVANALFVPIGTGIAAAAIVDGHLLDASGYAGELGHIDVGHGEPCACGARGCLEAIASAAAIARRYCARTGHVVISAAQVHAAARSGDPVAQRVWDEALTALADGLATASTLFGPEVIIIGGGLSRAGNQLLTPLAERLHGKLTFQRRPRLVQATLGDRAGCLGAALIAWNEADRLATDQPSG